MDISDASTLGGHVSPAPAPSRRTRDLVGHRDIERVRSRVGKTFGERAPSQRRWTAAQPSTSHQRGKSVSAPPTGGLIVVLGGYYAFLGGDSHGSARVSGIVDAPPAG